MAASASLAGEAGTQKKIIKAAASTSDGNQRLDNYYFFHM